MYWFALTPALSPRRGSAKGAVEFITSSAALVACADAARDSIPLEAVAALPLLGERVGVRAEVISNLIRLFLVHHRAAFQADHSLRARGEFHVVGHKDERRAHTGV